VLILVLAVSAASEATAGDRSQSAGPEPKPFTALKRLVGTWQGNAKMGESTMPVTIVYESTAAGSAVLERLFPGTPHEMISVHTADGDGVAMTHYCALGNRPRMTLRRWDTRSLAFEVAGSDGLRAATDAHMHAMTVAFTDADHIRETWTSFDKGQPKDEKVFELARKR
jgi:hypothetical protein